jgi:glycerate kinase
MPRALIACDKFKGSLSAEQACAAIQCGLGEAWDVDFCPIADGGEGFVAAMVVALNGTLHLAPCHDALGRSISAEYGLVTTAGKSTVVMEMSAASGIWRLRPEERNPALASTFGTGEMMRHAIEKHQPEKIIIGIGGSATNDAGAGMAAALGVEFLDDVGHSLSPTPESLRQLARIETSARMPLPQILVACDVDNPLCGPRGASAIYGPQKGASAEDVLWLDALLQRIAELSNGTDHALTPGAGAAGGLGFGLLHFCDAQLVPGFDMVADAIDLRSRVQSADLVITGEGSLDAQSLCGKGPIGIAKLAQHEGKPSIAVAGHISAEVIDAAIFLDHCAISSLGHSLEISMARAAEFLEQMVREKSDFWKKVIAP